jgi:hypothetical protein
MLGTRLARTVEADRVGPRRMAVIFDDIDGVPAEFADIGENMAFQFIVADAMGFGRRRPALPCSVESRLD